MSRTTIVAAVALLATALAQAPTYRNEILKWRKAQEADLRAEGGWLSVAGLFWLKDGDNAIGSDSKCTILLPKGCPKAAGILEFHDGKATLIPNAGVLLNGKPATRQALKTDADGAPDRVQVGAVTFTIIQRGPRIGVRLYDPNCVGRKKFKGMRWFPVDESRRITAQFVPYSPPKRIPVTNVLGDTTLVPCPGYVTFTYDGKECRLDAESEDSGLFLNFSDLTSGKETYGAGRFLDTPPVQDGKVVIDFNQAYNPPCAFTAFATCPLPPDDNHLTVAVRAGEKAYHGPSGRRG